MLSLQHLLESDKSILHIYSRKGRSHIDLPGEPFHSFIYDTLSFPDEVLVLPLLSSTAMRVSLSQKGIINTFQALPTFNFYGHGLYTPDRSHILTTEYSYEKMGEGYIVFRNARSLKVTDKIPVGGYLPHDITFSRDNGKVIVTNGGQPISSSQWGNSNVTSIDLKNGHVTELTPMGPTGLSYTHLCQQDEKYICNTLSLKPKQNPSKWVAWERIHQISKENNRRYDKRLFSPSPIVVIEPGQPLLKMFSKTNSDSLRNGFEVIYDPKYQRILSTHTTSDSLFIWDAKTYKLVGLVSLPGENITDVTYFKDHYLLSSRSGKGFLCHRFTLKTSQLEGSFGTAHMLTF